MEAFIIPRETPIDFMKISQARPEPEAVCVCRRGEVLPFQILAEGNGEIIREILWEDFSDGMGHIIPGGTGRVVSLQMRDDTGKDYQITQKAEGRAVLWAYLEIPGEIPAGQYTAKLRILTEGGEACGVVCRIRVRDETAANHGYDDLDALSRIQWFRSRKGLTPVIPEPFIPLQWDGDKRTAGILGRRIVIGENGLPEEIFTCFDRQNRLTDRERPLLREPWRLTVTTDMGTVDFIKRSDTAASLEDHLQMKGEFDGGRISLSMDARIEFDGYCTFDMILTAKEDCTVFDISLETALEEDAARYFVGLGRQGGYFQEALDFHWDGKSHQDSFWIGDINRGLRLQLKDDGYQKPNINIYYGYKPLRDSNWSNGGNGGVQIGLDGRIRAYTGAHKLEKGKPLHLTAVLMITPLKPIDWREHFSQRYYQSYTERTEEQWRERAGHDGINVINIHHGTDLNPYINYPFYEAECLKAFTEEMHQRGVQVKIYNTIREMTTKMKEFPIIRSMGYEILEPSAGIMGATLWQEDARQWIRARYGADIIPAWREMISCGKYKGETDASVLTNGKSPLCNYYVEGLDWLVKRCGIDGIYIDDLSYDRNTMKRVRRVLDQGRRRKIDMHSWNHYEPRAGMTNSLNLYTELLPYVDRLWIGEGFDYEHTDPGYWMVEMSGIPYGLTADMLQNGGNFYRGLLFGESVRHGWSGDASDVWKLWDDFGIAQSHMTGYWDEENPAVADDTDVYTTCYRRADTLMICIASWASGGRMVRLRFREGLEIIRLYAPKIPGRQVEREYRVDDALPIEKNAGLVLIAKLRR